MTILTIIFDDKTVGKNGEFYSSVDLSSAPSGIHALQWDGLKGWIEYSIDEKGNKKPNEIISELPSWVEPIEKNWEIVKNFEIQTKEKNFLDIEQKEQQQKQFISESPIKN